jgi:hypothetical protein
MTAAAEPEAPESPPPELFRVSLRNLIRIGLAVVLAMVLAGFIAGRVTAHHPPAAATAQAPQPPVPDPAAPLLTIRDVAGPLSAVLADLRDADRHATEAWVTDGYSNDLVTLIEAAGNANGIDPLNVNARRFASDAAAYRAAHDPYLGDWRKDYARVREDLNAMAADCGLEPAPAPYWLRTGD